MRLDVTFVRSKLGRRIVALFVLCALVPITLLAAISLWNVNSQLRRQNREQLRQASHEEGMGVYERLTFVEADLRLAASDPNIASGGTLSGGAASGALRLRLKGLERISESGARQTIFGNVSEQLELTPGESAHLKSGKSVLATRECEGGRPCVIMARALNPEQPREGLLVAEISNSYLLGAEGIAEANSMCILDSQGNQIACSGEAPLSFPSNSFPSASGQLQWKDDGREYESDYWQLFLKPNFYADHWTIVASEDREDIFAPVAHFKRIFLLVALLTLWVVLLLSLTQIRRNLVPLGELQKGTRQIAAGDFQSRVTVKSGDEFEDVASSFNSMAARIEKQFNTLKARNVVDQAILSSWDIEQVVDSLLEQLRSILPYQIASVSLLDPDCPGQVLSYISKAGAERDRRCEAISISKQELSALSNKPETSVITINDSCPRFLTPLASCGMRSFLVIPIMVRGSLSAIVSLGYDAAPIWTAEDMVQARQVGDQAGVALSNARLVTDLQDLNLGILTALARAIDAKSPWTAGHSERVTSMALKIAREMKLSQKDFEILRCGGLLHDIGKIGVRGDLLDKPGKLTSEEFSQVREHVEIGKRILEPIRAFREFLPVVLEHHEWVDGSGYPFGLKADEISIHARIFAIADCYDAMISDRPYRPGLPLDSVLEILQRGAGRQFDSSVMEAFLRVIDREQALPTGETVPASSATLA
jgi:putative nucleotidyltransferase with HDIG domain